MHIQGYLSWYDIGRCYAYSTCTVRIESMVLLWEFLKKSGRDLQNESAGMSVSAKFLRGLRAENRNRTFTRNNFEDISINKYRGKHLIYVNKQRLARNGGKQAGDVLGWDRHLTWVRNGVFLRNTRNVFNILLTACSYGDLELVKYYHARGMDIHADGEGALCFACDCGHLPIVEYLIKHGANINVKNETAVMRACQYGRFRVAKYLIQCGADIHTSDALYYACVQGHLKLGKYLKSLGAPLGESTFVWACGYNQLHVVKWLVEQCGVDINTSDGMALYYASYRGHLRVVKYLVECGADIHAKGDRAMRGATSYLRSDVVEFLRSIG